MRAVLRRSYGSPDVLEVADVEPPIPGEGEVLVRVAAASLNAMDRHFMRGEPKVMRLALGLGRPKDPRVGADLAGRVEAVGPHVTRFRTGDAVFGTGRGAFAELAVASEAELAPVPAGVPFDHAAAAPVAGLTALQALRDQGRVRAEQKVLVNGAAGGVGTFAVQIAKTMGAHVTGVTSAGKVDVVQAVGADHVLDRAKEDFTQHAARYDVLVDCSGDRALADCRRALAPHGVHVPVGGPTETFLRRFVEGTTVTPFTGRRYATFVGKVDADDLAEMANMLETKQVTPFIGARVPLEGVAEAMRDLEAGRLRGKVVVQVA